MKGKGAELAGVQDPPCPTMVIPEGDPLTPVWGGQSKWEALSGFVADFHLWEGGHYESQHEMKSPKMYQKSL